MKGLLPKVAYGLLAVLLVAAILIGIGQRESTARPVASSYNPSGLHALQELLDRNGIPTVISRLRQPQLGEKDLVIAAYIEDGPTIFGNNPLEPLEKYLEKFINRGGRVLVLPFESDFRKRSQQALKSPTSIVNADGNETLQISTSPITYANLSAYDSGVTSSTADFLPFEYEDLSYSPWLKRSVDSNEPFLALSSKGKGILARSADGLFATNRFLDRDDNAKFALK
ncbi:MAG: hypothetical protein H7Y17_11910, partial [Chlorobia bacterium]|nr:hypothetical protein [Fimbriimonadaceae bacterium]